MLFSVLSVCCARSRPFLNRGRPLQPRSVRAPRAFPALFDRHGRPLQPRSVRAPRAFPALFNRRGQPLHPRSVRAPRVPGPFQSSRATASSSFCPCAACVPGPEGSALARRTGRIFKPRCTFRNVSRFRRRGCVRRASSQVFPVGVSWFQSSAAHPSRISHGSGGVRRGAFPALPCGLRGVTAVSSVLIMM